MIISFQLHVTVIRYQLPCHVRRYLLPASNCFLVMYTGISYLPPTEEQKLRESLEQKFKQYDKLQTQQFSSPAFTSPSTGEATVFKGPVQVPEEYKDFLENIWYTLTKWKRVIEFEL